MAGFAGMVAVNLAPREMARRRVWRRIAHDTRRRRNGGRGKRGLHSQSMAGIILLLVLGVGVGALILWGIRLPPTRPRPDSRYRGRTYMSVHRKLKRPKPPE